MRKLVVLSFLLAVLVWAGAFEPVPAEAYQTCNVYCQYVTLRCCTNGTCSTSPGTLNCNGTVVTCTAADAHEACEIDCWDNYDNCLYNCNDGQCAALCGDLYNLCIRHCGPSPATSFGC